MRRSNPKIRIEEITGLSHGSIMGDIIVGTATIDIGVDFAINRLIFEANTAANSCKDWVDWAAATRIRYNLVPAQPTALSMAKRLGSWPASEGLQQRGLGDGDAVDRPTVLRDVIQDVYPNEATFFPYLSRWASLQDAHIVRQLDESENDRSLSPYHSIARRLRTGSRPLFPLPADGSRDDQASLSGDTIS